MTVWIKMNISVKQYVLMKQMPYLTVVKYLKILVQKYRQVTYKYYLYFEIYSNIERARTLLLNLLEYATNTDISLPMLKEHGSLIAAFDAIPEILNT